MHELAVQVLANRGHGGHRILFLVLLVVVAVIAGWIIYALRARRNRGQS